MKKLFFIAVVILTGTIANSQDNKVTADKKYNNTTSDGSNGQQIFDITKGDWLVGGTESYLSYQYKGNSNSKMNTWNFTPRYGYFVRDKLALGLSLNYSSNSQPNLSNSYTYSNFQAAPFVRYYFLPSTS